MYDKQGESTSDSSGRGNVEAGRASFPEAIAALEDKNICVIPADPKGLLNLMDMGSREIVGTYDFTMQKHSNSVVCGNIENLSDVLGCNDMRVYYMAMNAGEREYIEIKWVKGKRGSLRKRLEDTYEMKFDKWDCGVGMVGDMLEIAKVRLKFHGWIFND